MTPEQVEAIYFFLVLAVVQGKEKVEEDHYPAMLKWKRAAWEGNGGNFLEFREV